MNEENIVYASILISRHIRSELGRGSPICIRSFDEEEEGNMEYDITYTRTVL